MKTTQWNGLETLESRLMLDGVLDSVGEVFIEQGIRSWAGQQPYVYSFEVGLEMTAAGQVESARFRRADQPDAWQALDVHDSDEGEEWYFEVEGDDLSVFDPYGDVVYIIEVTPTVGDAQTITVDYSDPDSGAALVQPSQMPQFTGLYPYMTGVPTQTTFAWAPITDPSIVSLELEVEVYDDAEGGWAELGEFALAPDATSSGEVALEADRHYQVGMLWDNSREGDTPEGVPFFITKYTELEMPFSTQTGVFDPILEGYILQGVQDLAGGQSLGAFEFGFTAASTDWFQEAFVQTPGGQTYVLDEYEPLDVGGDWWFEIESDDPADLSDFTGGLYTLILEFTDGFRAATRFEFADPDTHEPIVPPASAPVFVTPADGATDVAPGTAFIWEAIDDPNVAAVELDVENTDLGRDAFEVELDPTATSYAPGAPLAEQAAHEAWLSFFTGHADLTNDDGVAFSAGAYRTAGIAFTTGQRMNPADRITGGFLEFGVNSLADDSVRYVFEIGFCSDQTGWFETAEVRYEDGPWLAMVAETDEEAYEWYYEAAGDSPEAVAQFGPGTYTFRLSFDDHSTVTTTLVLDGAINLPEEMPAFTFPLNGAADVAADAVLAWEAVDPAILELWLDVEDLTAGQSVFDDSVDPAETTAGPLALQQGHTYEAELEIITGWPVQNPDGITWHVGAFASRTIEFATAGETADLAATFVGAAGLGDPVLAGRTGTVSVGVDNLGGLAAAGAATLNVWLSEDGQLDDGDTLVGARTVAINLAPGGARTDTVAVAIPQDVQDGAYHLLVQVVAGQGIAEGSDANNVDASDAIVVEQPRVDLACQITDMAFAAQEVLPGDRGTVTVTVANEGNVNAVGPSVVTLYVSNADILDDTAIQVGRAAAKLVLAPGGTRALNMAVTLPADVEFFDALYFHAVVAADAIGEADVANNGAAAEGPQLANTSRDLAGEALTFAMPEVIAAGDTAVARIMMTNLGNMPVTGPIALRAYARTVGDPFLADIPLGEAVTVNVNLLPGGRLAAVVPVRIDAPLEPGAAYELYIALDDGNAVEETDEANEVMLGEARQYVQRFGAFEGHRNHALVLSDALDQPVTFTLVGGGYGTVETDGEGRFEIALTGTTARSVVRIATAAGQTTAIHTLDADADLGSLLADSADLTGSMTFAGGVGRIVLRDVADQHQITIGPSSLTTNLTLGNVADLSIDTPNPIVALKVAQWLDSDGDDTIAAPSIASLTSAGAFQANLELSGLNAPRGLALGTVRIAGGVDDADNTDTDWTILEGSIGTVDIAGATDNFALAGTDARLIRLADAADASVTLTGALAVLQAGQWTGGAIEAASINTLTAAGDFGASMTVAGTLANARIGGAVTAGVWTVGGLGVLNVASVDGWTLDLGGAAMRTLILGDATDTSVTAGSLGVVRANTWLGGTLTADSIGAAVIAGDFSAAMALDNPGAQALRSLTVGGDVTGGDWTVTGGVGVVRVNGTLDGGTWNVSEGIGQINATALGAVDITADSIGAIIARTDMVGTRVTATQAVQARRQALGRLTVSGTIEGSTIRSTGSIGAVVAGAMIDSALFAGVRPDYDEPGDDGVQDLPTGRDAFVQPDADVLATLGSLTLRGLRSLAAGEHVLSNTNVAAGRIAKAVIQDVGYDNSGTPFGFAVLDGMSLAMKDGRLVRVWGRATWPDDTGDFVADILQAVP
ncbi:MAG: hypothetical protein GX591_08505 [Planctomycetes bacterium]|nr:hypothetical protein [Planctomycetota bacterium]